MLPHPIMAREDDAEAIILIIKTLPSLFDEFFTCVEKVYVDTRGEDYRMKLNITYSNIQRSMLTLHRVPKHIFYVYDAERKVLVADDIIVLLLERLEKLFLTNVIGTGPQALSWSKPSSRVATELAEYIEKIHIIFPRKSRWVRNVIEYHSLASLLLFTLYGLCVLFIIAVSLVCSIARPVQQVGIPLVVIASLFVLCATMSMALVQYICTRALHSFYTDIYNIHVSYGGSYDEWLSYVSNEMSCNCHNNLLGINSEKGNKQQQQQQHKEMQVNHNVLQGNVIPGSPHHIASPTTNNKISNKNNNNNNINNNIMNYSGISANISRIDNHYASSLTTEWSGCNGKGHYVFNYNGTIGYVDAKSIDAQLIMIAYDDKEYRVTRWNNAAEELTGLLEPNCLGKPLQELVMTSRKNNNICDVLRNTKPGTLLRIKLRSLATVPITLYTMVAPVINAEQEMIGCMLICATAKDNLLENRKYLHSYQIHICMRALSVLQSRTYLHLEDAMLVQMLHIFSETCTITRVAGYAQEMVSSWEWTTPEQFIGQALGSALRSHDVNIDSMCPQTFCISPMAIKIITNIRDALMEQDKCKVRVQMVNLTSNVVTLCVLLCPMNKSTHWDMLRVIQENKTELIQVCGFIFTRNEYLVVQIPCQVAALLDDFADDEENQHKENLGNQQELLTQARAIINCTVNVVTAVTNMGDQHNLSLILLKTMFVSLTSVQEVDDLERRLRAIPCEIDVVICDYGWLTQARELLLSTTQSAPLVIPLLGEKDDTSLLSQFKYCIHLPLSSREVHSILIDVGKSVSLRKNAAAALKEREEILTLRQDSPWTKGKVLGRGSYGAVYEATSDLTGGKMAVKMFYFSADRESSINQLLNEIKIMCSLNHPNVVHYFHCERKENNVNLFMELCECSLTDLIIGRHPCPPQLTVVQILHQVFTAVAYLHSRGIAHRDIKPQNILLKGDCVKLTDFGTARKENVMKEVQGTFRYMAPEVYKGEVHNLSCDVWSLGCLVCELFGCVPQFMEKASLLGQMTSAMPYLDDLPNNSNVRDLVYRCFRVDPTQRPLSAHLLNHALLNDEKTIEEVSRLPSAFTRSRTLDESDRRESAFSIMST